MHRVTTVAHGSTRLLHRLLEGRDSSCLTHLELLPPRPGVTVDWPAWTPPELRAAFAAQGIPAPWAHQAAAADHAHAGRHVVVATGTASGKSLAYQLPVLSALLADPRATALYLAPTKALAADQLRCLAELAPAGVRPSCYDGDTPREQRDWARQHSRFVLTNPDMIGRGILPRHESWSMFLRRLTYVVVDECHAYRGVFGSHVAHVLRRLRRLAARYGRDPVFVLASATAGQPGTTAARLIGADVHEVTEDASPRGGLAFALWEPPLLPPTDTPWHAVTDADADGPTDTGADGPAGYAPGAHPVRRSALREAADLLADAVAGGVRTLAFVRSRRGAEAVATLARDALAQTADGLEHRVAAYRSGYLPEERRELERGLLDGSLVGLATTTALELGIDLTGLDAVIMTGYPGRLASMWQQAGRAGRRGRDAVCVLVARDDPLDTYLVHHPDTLFGRPVEACVLDPANPHVLGPHLAAAAAELPLKPADLALFGGAPAEAALAELVAAGVVRRRPSGWYWTGDARPDVDLRGAGGAPVTVVETGTGRLLGTVDAGSSHFLVHPGAVYVHQGASYVVDDLDPTDAVALVHAEDPPWTTHPRDSSALSVGSVRSYVDAGPVGLFLGEVEVTARVTGYQRRKRPTGEVIDTRPLDLPTRRLNTVAVWWTVSAPGLDRAGVDPGDIPGALHAAEHAAIGLLPLVATCDRWDIGGISTAMHPDTGAATVFVYDGHPGGAGFAERAFHAAGDWLRATRDVIAACGCAAGCPSCVQSPKCGNGNAPLSKDGAVKVLDLVLDALEGN
ncbi:DEAD/DEAH box helicase [Virgisporangium ochraceum]|uniref:DEAD/DEAH box helicase n=1 Tax=Virgisporangium ochraceum TaxID=65505 RepID=A0A8J3ZS51_9ACTN|nr:DEAD/DEAH box helicase [Virgisporangium ochraceum]